MKLKYPVKEQNIFNGILNRYAFHKYYKAMNRMLNKPFEQCDSINLDIRPVSKRSSIDLITIAFNNTHVLKHQIRKIKANISDKNYTHIIADNSNDQSQREKIKNICITNNVAYISLPVNRIAAASFSHAAALNWVYYNVVLKRVPRWFGFLDHDIFLLRPVQLEKLIGNQPFYGPKILNADYWFIWVGLSFFESIALSSIKVDFSPTKVNKTYLDTGGALWHSIYKNVDPEKYNFAKWIRFGLNSIGYTSSDIMDYFDNCWFHSTNASKWRNVPDNDSIIDDIIENEKIYCLKLNEKIIV